MGLQLEGLKALFCSPQLTFSGTREFFYNIGSIWRLEKDMQLNLSIAYLN